MEYKELVRRYDDSKDKKDIAKVEKFMIIFGIIAMVIFAIVLAFYFCKFNNSLSPDNNVWGAFGDYVGGVLNPVFAFLSFMALLLTLIQQQKQLIQNSKALFQNQIELENSTRELANSASALEASKEISLKQVKHMEIQAEKEDIYRMIKHVYGEIEKYINSKEKVFVLPIDPFSHDDQDFDRHLLHEVFTFPSCKKFNISGSSVNLTTTKEIASRISALLIELKDHLQSYQHLVDNDHITQFYILRVLRWAKGLHYHEHFIDIYAAYFDNDMPLMKLEIEGAQDNLQRFIKNLCKSKLIDSSARSLNENGCFSVEFVCQKEHKPQVREAATKCNIIIKSLRHRHNRIWSA